VDLFVGVGTFYDIHRRSSGTNGGRTMTGNTDDYVSALAEELSLRDVPPEAAERIVREVSSHLAESGEDPIQSFGAVKHYADEFAPRSRTRRMLVPLVMLSALLGAGSALMVLNGIFGFINPSHGLWGLEPATRVVIGAVLFVCVIALIAMMTVNSRRRLRDWRL
jgi:hypothetical protein